MIAKVFVLKEIEYKIFKSKHGNTKLSNIWLGNFAFVVFVSACIKLTLHCTKQVRFKQAFNPVILGVHQKVIYAETKLQVYLSMYDLSSNTRRYRVNYKVVWKVWKEFLEFVIFCNLFHTTLRELVTTTLWSRIF